MSSNQAIAGVTPLDEAEIPVATIWPSISVFGLGRLLGQAYNIAWPNVFVLRLGNLIALASIPIALMLYFVRVLPFFGRRYVLTNNRLLICTGIRSKEQKSVQLDHFDDVQIRVRPGQDWFHSGDLIFYQDSVETFRLESVSRPEVFRISLLDASRAFVGVKNALEQEGDAA